MDELFEAVRDGFAKNRDVDWAQVGLVVGLAVVAAVLLSVGLGRWRAHRRMADQVDAVATAAGLTEADLAYLTRIARAAGLPVLEVMSNLAPFEHATARALATESPPLRPDAGSGFERVRRLRKALGFSPLSPHLWLLSTRELLEGDPIALPGGTGHIVEVNEAIFAVDLPAIALPALGGSIPVTTDRTDDARYHARVRLLAVEAPPGTTEDSPAELELRRAFFAHDEAPERQQQREYVRVRVPGTVPVTVRTASAAPISGTLFDVSAGGLALDLPLSPGAPLRRGDRLLCTFALGEGETFDELAALVVTTAAGSRAGMQHVRLSFHALAEALRDRLAAAVARQERLATALGRQT